MAERFFLDTDNDAHWYIIPEKYREEWDVWLGFDPDDERGWNTPEYAKALGGSPTRISFENPEF